MVNFTKVVCQRGDVKNQGGMVDRVPKELYVAVRALCLIDSAPKQSGQKFKHNIDHTGI